MRIIKFLPLLPLLALCSFPALAAKSSHHPAGIQAVLTAPPKGPYRAIDSLVPMPKFVPGYGYLYVDPSTLPAGPFLGYDQMGKLVSITYMLPLKELNDKKGFLKLGATIAGVKVNHTDVVYNNGHPGVNMPHIHVTQWLIPHEDEKRLK